MIELKNSDDVKKANDELFNCSQNQQATMDQNVSGKQRFTRVVSKPAEENDVNWVDLMIDCWMITTMGDLFGW